MTQPHSNQLSLTPNDNQRLANLCGQCDENLRQVEAFYGVEIHNRGHEFQISGPNKAVQSASKLLLRLYEETEKNDTALDPKQVHLFLEQTRNNNGASNAPPVTNEVIIHTRQGEIKGRNPNQKRYLMDVTCHAINFAIGPAGTGKTYLAIACAVAALKSESVNRILLTRPAVEAGERLGFLPGDLSQKIDPYLRPLYDALFELMGDEQVSRLVEQNVIEVAPLAYMRGRTLNDAFIILDEAQNTTNEQMKMFLTRLGFGSTAVITGDITQIDLPKHQESGLIHAMHVLKETDGISIMHFGEADVVRHPLVQKIVAAYERYENNPGK